MVFSKRWDQQKIDKYIGKYKSAYFCYAQDKRIYDHGTSGGCTTALLSNLLQQGIINGALVCHLEITNNEVFPKFFVATTTEELIRAQGSKYIAVNFIKEALPLIRSFDGRLAVVSLPCDAHLLRKYCEKDQSLAEKVVIIFALFCGHNTDPNLINSLIKKITPDEANLEEFTFRYGSKRGLMRARFDNGMEIVKPTAYYKDFQNLYFHCQEKCLQCHDQTGYDGDISVGDIWSAEMMKNPIKHNALISRSEIGEKVIREALANSIINGTETSMSKVCDGQARGMPTHYNVSARARAGKIFGFNIKDEVNERVGIVNFLIASIILLNKKISQSRIGWNIIQKTPRIIIKLYLYFFKALESL